MVQIESGPGERPAADAGRTDNFLLPHAQLTLTSSLIFQNRFSIDRDLDDVADDDAASVQGVVPTDAKVLPAGDGATALWIGVPASGGSRKVKSKAVSCYRLPPHSKFLSPARGLLQLIIDLIPGWCAEAALPGLLHFTLSA